MTQHRPRLKPCVRPCHRRRTWRAFRAAVASETNAPSDRALRGCCFVGSQSPYRALQLIVSTFLACLEREWFFDRRSNTSAFEIRAAPCEVFRHRQDDAIAETYLECAGRDQSSRGLRANQGCQFVLR